MTVSVCVSQSGRIGRGSHETFLLKRKQMSVIDSSMCGTEGREEEEGETSERRKWEVDRGLRGNQRHSERERERERERDDRGEGEGEKAKKSHSGVRGKDTERILIKYIEVTDQK